MGKKLHNKLNNNNRKMKSPKKNIFNKTFAYYPKIDKNEKKIEKRRLKKKFCDDQICDLIIVKSNSRKSSVERNKIDAFFEENRNKNFDNQKYSEEKFLYEEKILSYDEEQSKLQQNYSENDKANIKTSENLSLTKEKFVNPESIIKKILGETKKKCHYNDLIDLLKEKYYDVNETELSLAFFKLEKEGNIFFKNGKYEIYEDKLIVEDDFIIKKSQNNEIEKISEKNEDNLFFDDQEKTNDVASNFNKIFDVSDYIFDDKYI